MRAEYVEGKRPAGQRAEKRLLESSEVNNGWRRMTGECGGFVGQFPPGRVRIDAALRHLFSNARQAHHRGRNVLAFWKGDQPGVRACDRRAGARPTDLKEMSARSRAGGLAVDHQHVEICERL